MATQFDTIFAALQTTGVRYVVVGGVAVNLHGYQRFTKDVDLVIELVADRALKALQALEATGYRPTLPVKLTEPPAGGFEAAELYQLRMALKSTYAQRLQDLQDMLNFNAEAEARNPRLRWAAARLHRP